MGDATGDGRPGDGETPVHRVELAAYRIDATPVTNDDFAAFARDTGYRTEAERYGSWSPRPRRSERGPSGCSQDAPRTSSQMTTTSSAGRRGFPGLMDGEIWCTNIFQGTFPTRNTGDDGWLTTAPVRSYRRNGFGLWQTVGNVWEWCQDNYDPRVYARRAGTDPVRNPLTDNGSGARVLRGGSYLCHDSYCNRYRNSARSSNTPDSSMSNSGFRTVAETADPA